MSRQEDDSTTVTSFSRRPVGTRRRQLEWLTNFVLVVVSLLGCSVGAGLIGFYQLHLLSFISYEFFIIPLVLLGNQKWPSGHYSIVYQHSLDASVLF